MMDLKNCHMGVCGNGGINLFNREEDKYDYLTADDLDVWHNDLSCSSPLSIEGWFGLGHMILPKEYLL